MNEVLKAIKNRRSTRGYKPGQIKQEEIDLIIEAAIHAPTGHNMQPWYFTVIQDRAVIKHISDTAKSVMAKMEVDWISRAGRNPDLDITHGAPTLVIVSGRTDAVTWRTDCDAAIENMMIAAESLNIGSLWVGFAGFCFRVRGEAEKIGVPNGYEAYYGVALGYKLDEAPQPAPKRKTDVVNYIR